MTNTQFKLDAAAGEVFPRDPEKTYGLMELVKGTSPLVEKGPEDTIMSWPHLMILEVLAGLGTTVLLLLMSFFAQAPLREMANPNVSDNPSKAAWYFLSLQEMLLHMNATLGGVIIPLLVVIALMAIPYIDRSKKDVSIWFASRKGKGIALMSLAYTFVCLVGLILFDEFIRVRSLVSEPEIWPGWVIPIVIIGGLMVLLYVLIKRWKPSTREALIGLFTAFVTTYFVLTLSALFFRGYGMHLTWPWDLPPGALPF
jgi:menaquinol-cytochrome c reductase cytochrome b/c subunit